MEPTGSLGSTFGPVGASLDDSVLGPAPAIPALTVVHHPDLARVGDVALLPDLARGRPCPLSRLAPELAAPGAGTGAPLGDRHLSREPLLFAPGAEGGVRLVVGASRTRVVADGAPLAGEATFPRASLERGVILELSERIVLLLHLRRSAPEKDGADFGLIGASEGLARVRFDIRQVADLDVPVLIRGETGTGKELVARAVHAASRRRSGTFVGVNLGSVPPTLAAAELFGAVKGAFTGSVQARQGFFRRAHGGTLFLDEIGEVTAEVQAMLLRVLETGEIYAVGSQAADRVDVRVLAATDSNLEARAKSGDFRAPLLHRLGGYVIWLPPLSDRREDFGRLLLHFLREKLARVGDASRLDDPEAAWLPAGLVARLARHPWPGNVRQLRNVARQLAIASRGQERFAVTPSVERLLAEDPTGATGARRAAEAQARSVATGRGEERAAAPPRRRAGELSDAEVAAAMRAHRYDLQAAAAALGVSRPSLYERIALHPTLRTAGDLSPEEIAACHAECAGDLDRMVDRLEVSRRALARRLREVGLAVREAGG
ncbi:MAG TPA: sigma 54-interacting transcriptional regulator [Thermoanaerobaculia bacterium]|nr:sigma 54-interacting transcriptional regulator [Thermoanaerobaculia bacterium]